MAEFSLLPIQEHGERFGLTHSFEEDASIFKPGEPIEDVDEFRAGYHAAIRDLMNVTYTMAAEGQYAIEGVVGGAIVGRYDPIKHTRYSPQWWRELLKMVWDQCPKTSYPR